MATISVPREAAAGLARLREFWLHQAETHFRRVLHVQPNHAGALHLLGVTYCKLRRFDEGISLIDKAILHRSDSGALLYDLAVALRASGKPEKSKEAYEKAIALWPGLAGVEVADPSACLMEETYSIDRFDYDFKFIDYDYRATVRYGGGRATHRKLFEMIDENRNDYLAFLEQMAQFNADFAKIDPNRDYDGHRPYWYNLWFGPLDGMALYSFLCLYNPTNYIEVGSGVSTKFARLAITNHRLQTKITSIDPFPRQDIDLISDETLRQPFESIDVSTFDRLGENDILFIDSSHRCFQNSDVTVFFLDVLPRIAPNVLIHLHDIYLPDDYLSGFVTRRWNEQYLLATALLYGGEHFEILFPAWFVSQNPALRNRKDELLKSEALANFSVHGASFWLRKRPQASIPSSKATG